MTLTWTCACIKSFSRPTSFISRTSSYNPVFLSNCSNSSLSHLWFAHCPIFFIILHLAACILRSRHGWLLLFYYICSCNCLGHLSSLFASFLLFCSRFSGYLEHFQNVQLEKKRNCPSAIRFSNILLLYVLFVTGMLVIHHEFDSVSSISLLLVFVYITLSFSFLLSFHLPSMLLSFLSSFIRFDPFCLISHLHWLSCMILHTFPMGCMISQSSFL